MKASKNPVYGKLWTDHNILKKVVNFAWLQTFDDRKQKDVVLTSALSLSTRCRPFSSVRPRYLPVVTWQSRNACPQHVCLPLHLRNIKSTVFFVVFPMYCWNGRGVKFYSGPTILNIIPATLHSCVYRNSRNSNSRPCSGSVFAKFDINSLCGLSNN